MTDEALKKKREFWINPRAEQIVYSSSGAADKLFIAREKRYQHKEIHVIEYSAYAETKQLLEDAQQVNEMITKEVESCRNFVDAKCQRCDENEARTIEALAENEKLKTTLPTFIKLDPTTEQITRENAFVECVAMLQRQLAELKHENYDIRCQRQSKINELDELKFNKDNCEKRNAELTATLKLAEETLDKIANPITCPACSIEDPHPDVPCYCFDRNNQEEASRALATIKERMKS